MVAILYACKEKSIKICRPTFMLYNNGVSDLGNFQVLRSVGINPIRSIETAIITDQVGSFVNSHGINPANASTKNSVSVFVTPLNPYFNENKKIITVKISDAAVGITPTPAPFSSCPKKTTHDTIVHTSQV